jgi:ABC-type nitrate/sulfonate/bicarbonate transport system substrate-binding protein
MIVHATVKGGRYVIEEPADLPEGTTVELVVVEDSLDEMDPDERAALLASLDRGIAELRSGTPGIPAERVLRELKA